MSDTKSPYEIYRERVKEGATKLDKAPKEIPQHILWLKSMAIERIEDIDKLVDDNICTFRVQDGKEISLSQAIKNGDKPYKFGFTEQYVNILMNYAYEAGKKSNSDGFNRATEDMRKTLDKIKDALDDAGWIENNDY
jgi:hypothetical protein